MEIIHVLFIYGTIFAVNWFVVFILWKREIEIVKHKRKRKGVEKVAFGVIPLPGSKFGPCVVPCVHRDCAASRKTAGAACPGCGEKIGYQKSFTLGEGGEPWHLSCYVAAVDQEPEGWGG